MMERLLSMQGEMVAEKESHRMEIVMGINLETTETRTGAAQEQMGAEIETGLEEVKATDFEAIPEETGARKVH
jgi:hypothetical protein